MYKVSWINPSEYDRWRLDHPYHHDDDGEVDTQDYPYVKIGDYQDSPDDQWDEYPNQ